jgi:copper resistance protein B
MMQTAFAPRTWSAAAIKWALSPPREIVRRATGMQRKLLAVWTIACVVLAGNDVGHAHGNDDPLLYKVEIDELELRSGSGDDQLAWRGEAWLGKDEHKLLLKTRGERTNAATEEFELQLLYDQAIAPFWDLQFGWRGDFQPEDERNWFAFGFEGLAPGFIESELTAFAGGSGRTAARARFAYDLLLTQQLILEPELELDWYGKDDPANRLGSGIASLEAGLRLRYELRREFAPYIGLNWTGLYGDTKRYARADGEDSSDLRVLVGLRFWF